MIKNYKKNGFILTGIIVFAAIAAVIIVGLVSWFGVTMKATRDAVHREQAFQIAEAGIEYYRWHLAHAQNDFQDGTGTSTQPYIHEYKDKDGNKIGSFELTIIPPQIGSTIVTIISKGIVDAAPNVFRKIEVKMAMPSLAKYAFVTNSEVRFGQGTEVFGPIHSNAGVRFDGLAHNIISSAVSTYDDPDHSGALEFGVHTHATTIDPLPPASVPNRADVFRAGREFPVPAVDFNGFITNLSNLKTYAQADGFYLAPTNSLGYKIVLKTDDTFDLYQVTQLETTSSSCTNSLSQEYWGSYSVKNSSFVANYPFPDNGVLFFEDNLYVEGKINTARLTIATARFPESSSTYRHITVNNNLSYTNYDGTDSLALIAQGNINIGMVSQSVLRVDAALLAQNGKAGRFYYSNYCSPYNVRSSLTLYGLIASKQRYGFAYTDGSGYTTRNIIYDANLLYSPPPYFPLSSSYYETISWEEIE